MYGNQGAVAAVAMVAAAAHLGHGVVGEVHVAPAQLVADGLQLFLQERCGEGSNE